MQGLIHQIYNLLDSHVDENYRVSVVIVGPPGSGKSTIAEEVCKRLNDEYHNNVKQSGDNLTLVDGPMCIDLTGSIQPITPSLQKEIENNNGIVPSLVESTDFNPVKCIDSNNAQATVTIIGRGGIPNSIYIEKATEKDTDKMILASQIDIAQIVPMDGFHLSRACLDKFKDPEQAHLRRGSPATFDSNNFAELCRILAKTAAITPKKVHTDNLWGKIATTFYKDMPDIYVPSFDHAKKDPTIKGILISKFTRVLIFEGLYLLYDKENWKTVYSTLTDTGAAIFLNISVPETVLEDRVAHRHVKSGLVDNLDAGILKFRKNDLLNAKDIACNTISSDRIQTIENI
ncbi:similar to Saccharomyces cerevisiae YFR007W YFH7 Putative kinase with similarity to the phosphoribulokinase/uridine kinase/bacterial pantothenate kinase (PRK/URK/PANK) subfamily of P-loop kinases [Maudiozyma barnettii]|uniref:Similar to Saccharomyces cerevisiae YFR007W YFH7 Putative kinase with similarity to the phosphoribulokinase/uridine kinase/bacterial pantothenate kinase (PRK/URK/PANK) subfamily of P-loop kinases n=1 Tax=Maudiozyma barnettii TaxID=61262 RepID=A0A8H2VBX3_9SACH|nr:Yfh7p [Kazachstania barnettii]CAB4252450.1 similar to Saccharomyces cerevisiae YFR007W YFH7 Putative kinase with similarity to the phosphoribulokinase/uridine kinase/bacterial pantothenate kinase (PRK/URK/PANK) subfamily of P-loop kinases [Kazachstania barnettii]CAD1779185.1 similar to Saccharomyces cerevisiae YFR007W YFH7 Putative kinase with similarity to the phosphoribulokinase/uridine kinase/bacterial pantothenate kinase (PRK/URK/PANK) subfamily of P-loop kinases [Kazachstania barnettii]